MVVVVCRARSKFAAFTPDAAERLARLVMTLPKYGQVTRDYVPARVSPGNHRPPRIPGYLGTGGPVYMFNGHCCVRRMKDANKKAALGEAAILVAATQVEP